MRTFWITYRCSIKGGQIEGDLVADMPDDGQLTAAWLNQVRSEVRGNVLAKLSEVNKVDPSSVGQILILGLIPLEA